MTNDLRGELRQLRVQLANQQAAIVADLAKTMPGISPYDVRTPDGAYVMLPVIVARAQVAAALAGIG